MSVLGVRSVRRRRDVLSERGRAAIEQFPGIYLRVAGRIAPTRVSVDETTDVLVEGYPRSGNSFLVSWMARANPDLRIASHVHSIAHVHAALRRSVPVVIVIRPPEAAIASHAVYSPDLSLDRLIDRYRRFHLGVRAVADAVLVSPFPVTTGAPEQVIGSVEPRIARPLRRAPEGGVDEVMADMDRRAEAFHGSYDVRQVARPSDVRRSSTDAIAERLRLDHRDALARLDELHDELASCPSAITPS